MLVLITHVISSQAPLHSSGHCVAQLECQRQVIILLRVLLQYSRHTRQILPQAQLLSCNRLQSPLNWHKSHHAQSWRPTFAHDPSSLRLIRAYLHKQTDLDAETPCAHCYLTQHCRWLALTRQREFS